MPVQDVDPVTVRKWIDQGEAILIDVREHVEHDLESIPFADHHPLTTFDPAKIPVQEKRHIFLCAAGIRSDKAAKIWIEHHQAKEAYNLAGGIYSWVDDGFKTVRNHRESLEVQKRGFRLAGVLVLFSAVFSVFNPIFSILTALIGFGLLFLGDKGVAALPWLLSRFPLNKVHWIGISEHVEL